MGRMAITPAANAHHHAPHRAAHAAGLRYVSDATPGIRRRRAGRGFVYERPDGRPLRKPSDLRRIRALVIPPAWTGVWICPEPLGHIQAVGRDAKGRKQYRYHARWREVRDEAKYGRLAAFGRALPSIRAQVEADLARPGLPREKVLATVVRLLERTLIRVGNEEYARANRSFGLTTLRSHHVAVRGGKIRFQFRGKSGKLHQVGIADRLLSRIVKRCQDLPGQELFGYRDTRGRARAVSSEDVNRYLRSLGGEPFTAKDFRTWGGTVRAAFSLAAGEPCSSAAQLKKNVARAIDEVAGRLGNTPAICRTCYVHPVVVDLYMDGGLDAALGRKPRTLARAVRGLTPHESAVLRMLERRAAEGPPPEEERLQRQLRASLTAARRSTRARTGAGAPAPVAQAAARSIRIR